MFWGAAAVWLLVMVLLVLPPPSKAFTTQLVALARSKGLDEGRYLDGVAQLEQLPGLIVETLKLDEHIKLLAERFADKHHALFLGRGTHWPVAMEGALKLKQISYIQAEAYAAGELKHGPLAYVALLKGTDGTSRATWPSR